MLKRLLGETKATYTKESGRPIIYGYSKYVSRWRKPKRALLSYITHPFLAEANGENIVRFSNSGLALSWAQVLNELGYIVDIIDWDNDKFALKHQYDLVIFHGGKNFSHLSPQLNGKPQIIHYLTGSYWKFNNQQEDKRRADFKKRHGVEVARDRYIFADEDPVNEAALGVIVLGDPSMKATYPSNLQVLTVNNASYPDDHFDKTPKDYDSARHNFLFFAGSGNIHKGLDLVIDSFKDLKEHLYIVTVIDEEVLKVYKKELKQPNIHLIGQVGMRTAEFYELMDTCAFVILPSCSEGQAGSVVECMNQGLVPIVSKETRLDARKYGVVLEKSSISEIKNTVQSLSNLQAVKVKKMSMETRQVALSEHSPENFRQGLKQAIQKILNN